MKLLNTLREWLPMAGGGVVVALVGLLVVLSLLPPDRDDKAQPAPPQLPGDTCVVMPDGLRICDDVSAPAPEARP